MKLPKLPKLLAPPVLRAVEGVDEERSATWLELFFDLVFVVAIAQLAFALADDLSTGGFLRFALLFIPVWWSWAGYTNYADRFDTDDVGFRVMILAGMLAMTSLAVNVPEAFSGGSGAFAVSYVAVRAILILLYERARRHVPTATMGHAGSREVIFGTDIRRERPHRQIASSTWAESACRRVCGVPVLRGAQPSSFRAFSQPSPGTSSRPTSLSWASFAGTW